ncbi:MAG: acyl-CoA dehydrogenase [Saprospiraceae bacterium]|nr:acyl-CoA dehydrogenase [Saprospiraceae bacterium]
MAKQYMDMDTLKYLLYDVHDFEKVLSKERFADYDREAVDMFLDAVKDFSDKELYPTFMEMDETPAHFKDGQIHTHPVVGTVMKQGGELGLIAAAFSAEDGGLQMPHTAMTAAYYIMDAANNHLPGYLGLTQGAAELIVEFGSDALKEKYTPKMLTGEWAGTMCLTEPQAGSSLSDIVTTAYPQEDGSYKLKGQKIFISGGDHQHVDNVIHLVLARIEGAPAGTKGISLFVVPKNRIQDDGSLLENDVVTAGDYQKMGQKGYCTTHLMFGEQDDCQGWLVGEPNLGLKYMFLMMNGARIAVGRGAAAVCMAAYQASLAYAKERPQGRRVRNDGKKDVHEEPTLIINHPDVRRMLLLQKSISEGSLSLVALTALYHDLLHTTEDPEEKEKYHLLLELLTPICKTYPSEDGMRSISNGVQVLGGYGFCSEYILQQYYRDIRIFSIYEGTTGIQSLDLLGRKVAMKGGKAVMLLGNEIMQTIKEASAHEDLKGYAAKLGDRLKNAQEVLGHLSQFAMKGEFERYISDASIFMEYFSKIVVGWLWLQMASRAKQALLTGDGQYSTEFYESKVHTMKVYFKYELSRTASLADILMDADVLTIPDEEKVFA